VAHWLENIQPYMTDRIYEMIAQQIDQAPSLQEASAIFRPGDVVIEARRRIYDSGKRRQLSSILEKYYRELEDHYFRVSGLFPADSAKLFKAFNEASQAIAFEARWQRRRRLSWLAQLLPWREPELLKLSRMVKLPHS